MTFSSFLEGLGTSFKATKDCHNKLGAKTEIRLCSLIKYF